MSEFIIIRIHNAIFICKNLVSTRFGASSRLLITLESKFIQNTAMLAAIIDRSEKRNFVVQWYNAIVRFVARIFRTTKRKDESIIHVADITNEDQRTIEKIVFMGQTVKNILDLSIINDEGIISDEALQIISTTGKYLKN